MAFFVGVKNIHCPKCHFEGISKTRHSGIAAGIAGLLCLLVSVVLFAPLIIAVPVLWIYAICMPAKPICPKCSNSNPVSLTSWREQNLESKDDKRQTCYNAGMAHRIRSKRKYYRFLGICLVAAFFLYPFPRTDFLYRHAEVLNGKVAQLKGASFALFLDPSYYYKFKISPSGVRYTVSALGLSEESKALQRDYYVKKMKRGPLFWNFWWWRPRVVPESVLFKGGRKGNRFYFLYNRLTQVAYLYIQNT